MSAAVGNKAFDDIPKYFYKKEWEKMKALEKIIYVYMKRKYEAMTKLIERPQMSFGRLQGIFPKIVPKKPAEEGNDSKGMSEASGPQNDGKQLCPPGKPSTSEKINKTPGNREAQEKEERQGRAHPWSSQTTHNIDPKRGKHAWTHRLRERKQPVIYEEISDPEEDDE
ncbi:protein SSX7-like [Rhinopithecus roxellana]|uniref:protein SSX7-like n=1 Tax=Rhinopithecus roxellana TaxID=61622 RepID=UPI0012376BF1|nr:protein SSX7-like [Rhinopithecus roxellana]